VGITWCAEDSAHYSTKFAFRRGAFRSRNLAELECDASRIAFSAWPLQESDARRPAHGRASSIALLKIRGLTDKMASSFGDFIEAKF